MPNPNNLEHIIMGCVKQDNTYQKLIYKRFYGYALKIVFSYIYHYDKAVDVVNDGFVKVFKNFERFMHTGDEKVEQELMGWIRRIMINTAIDALRKNELTPEIGGIPEWVWEEKDKSQNTDQQLHYKELMIQVKRLPPIYRIVFNMFVMDGYSHQEIADTLNITVGTSKSNLSRAKGLLQKYIQEREGLQA